MTRLNLNESSLLAASGELSDQARAQLDAYLAENPAARAEFDAIKADYDLLRSLPRVNLSPEESARIAAAIKAGAIARLADRLRIDRAQRRRQLIRYAVAGLTAVAAAVAIVVTLSLAEQNRQLAVEESRAREVNDMIRAVSAEDAPNAYDQTLADIDTSIRQLEADSPAAASSNANSGEFATFINALASVPPDPDADSPTDPGSL